MRGVRLTGLIAAFLPIVINPVKAETGLTAGPVSGEYRINAYQAAPGILFDFGKKSPLSATDSVTLTSNGKDITPALTISPPVIHIAYVFQGVAPETQCRIRIFLDLIVGLNRGAHRNKAWSDTANNLCPDLNIRFTPEPIAAASDLSKGYSRLLVIRISDSGADLPGAPESVWDLLDLQPGIIEDKRDAARALVKFVRANIHGGFAWLPAGELPWPLTFTLASDGTTEAALTLEGPSILTRYRNEILIGGGVLLLLIGVVMFLMKRKAQPEPDRQIIIGYGDGCDIKLGEGEAEKIAAIQVFGQDSFRLVRLSSVKDITIDGKPAGKRTPISRDAELRIDNKKIVFS